MTTSKAKTMTLRQRLRGGCEKQLDELVAEGRAAIDRVSMPHKIGGPSLAKLVAGGEQKTHRHMLVTHLANNAEAALEKIYNNQQDLDLGDKK